MKKYLCTYHYTVSRVVEAESRYEAEGKVAAYIDCNNPEDIATLENVECKSITDEELAKILKNE